MIKYGLSSIGVYAIQLILYGRFLPFSTELARGIVDQKLIGKSEIQEPISGSGKTRYKHGAYTHTLHLHTHLPLRTSQSTYWNVLEMKLETTEDAKLTQTEISGQVCSLGTKVRIILLRFHN